MANENEMTMASLLRKAPLLLLGRLEILLLLSLLYGIVTTIITFPVIEALRPIISDKEANIQAIFEGLGAQLPFTVLLSMLFNAILLIPITRLLVDEAPFEGGANKYLTRISRIFVLQVTALAFFIVALMVMSVILAIFSAILPQSLALIIGVTAVFILLLTMYAVLNVAIVGEAIDSPTSLVIAWNMIKPVLMPLAAAFGAIKIGTTILAMLITLIASNILSSFELPWLSTVVDQSFGFAGQILHFSACLWATQAIMNKRNEDA